MIVTKKCPAVVHSNVCNCKGSERVKRYLQLNLTEDQFELLYNLLATYADNVTLRGEEQELMRQFEKFLGVINNRPKEMHSP